MTPEILFGVGTLILLAALVWAAVRAGRLSRREKAPGEAVAKARYERPDLQP